jgi:hypothetical protein
MAGREHTTEGGGANAQPSGCTLPIFHAPMRTEDAPPGPGYVSNDGHHFTCKNPVLLQAAFHVLVFRLVILNSFAQTILQDLCY